ncbi:MAG TPA: GPP34 family phosphoprotein [Streptosporangiaceae bacterium]|nr:GPP34 family phosphoprotein [Streptosporangiaceae bacterium]
MDVPLTLAEELLLLTGDNGGKPLAWRLHYGVAGALLADLDMAGRLGYSPERWVTVTDAEPTGDDELDAVLAEIASDRPQSMEYWVRELVSVQRTGRLAGRLGDHSDHRAWRAQLRSRVTRTIQGLSSGDDRAECLGAIIGACGLAAKVFPNLDRRGLKRRMAELSSGQRVAAAVRDATGQARLRAWLPRWTDFIVP